MFDGGYNLDIASICENITEAAVISIYFPMLRRTLLIDTRSDDLVRPYIGIVPMVRNAAERYESLKRLRPRLPRPESITLIPWTRRIGALENTGAWGCVLLRLAETGDEMELERARATLAELHTLEQQELRNAIRGRQYETIWRNPELGPATA